MISVRNYNNTDYNELTETLQEANMYDSIWDGKENLEGLITRNPQNILVAVDDNKVIGCIYIVEFGVKIAMLFRLVVRKDYRNKGIASVLIKEAEKIAKENGKKEIGLFVDANNQQLQSFYKNRGFGLSENPDYYAWKVIK